MLEGEPEKEEEKSKTKKKKVKIISPSMRVAGLSLQEWTELFFKPRLSLVELVSLKRVCRSFAAYKPLQALIKEKEQIAFGGFHRRHWNAFAPTTQPKVISPEFLNQNKGKYLVVWHKIGLISAKDRFRLQVCSSRHVALLSVVLGGKVKTKGDGWICTSFTDAHGKFIHQYTTGLNEECFF